MIIEIYLDGFQAFTAATDTLIKWIEAPSLESVNRFISENEIPLDKRQKTRIIAKSVSEGVDIKLNANGIIIAGTSNFKKWQDEQKTAHRYIARLVQLANEKLAKLEEEKQKHKTLKIKQGTQSDWKETRFQRKRQKREARKRRAEEKKARFSQQNIVSNYEKYVERGDKINPMYAQWVIENRTTSLSQESEDVQIAVVTLNGSMIRYIDHPSEAVQLAAVKQCPLAFGSIKNPTAATKLALQKAAFVKQGAD